VARADRPADEGLSVNVQSLLVQAAQPLYRGIDQGSFGARVTIGTCNLLGLHVHHDPVADGEPGGPNPYHALVRGLVEMRGDDPDRFEKTLDALAKASTVINVPPEGS
jgi:hypothetical protein